MNKSIIIRDWLDGNITSNKLLFYIKHYNELLEITN